MRWPWGRAREGRTALGTVRRYHSSMKRLHRFRRSLIRTAIAFSLIAITVWLALIGVARWLGPVPSRPLRSVILIVSSMDAVLDHAAEHARANPHHRLWFIDEKPSRLQRLGLNRPESDRIREDLLGRGVKARQFVVIPSESLDSHDQVRCLMDELRRGGGVERDVTVLTHRRSTRRWRAVLDQTLTPDMSPRVELSSVAEPRLHPTRWFRSRMGGKLLLHECLQTAFVLVVGEGDPDRADPYASLLDSPKELAKPKTFANPKVSVSSDGSS